ncbi:uncharacterized protein LOC131032586 isoform X3 [Cryptomeria japonica]|uniref:uncharacterized protein LOC131032586 isoform X3 n=1 Tax=Cryptomeria japonica TaxID=3369 RepID=UPI0027DA8D66|nr:uncharacterized protein LOC131032586 isoform X3 [Cryptomeria japonica]
MLFLPTWYLLHPIGVYIVITALHTVQWHRQKYYVKTDKMKMRKTKNNIKLFLEIFVIRIIMALFYKFAMRVCITNAQEKEKLNQASRGVHYRQKLTLTRQMTVENNKIRAFQVVKLLDGLCQNNLMKIYKLQHAIPLFPKSSFLCLMLVCRYQTLTPTSTPLGFTGLSVSLSQWLVVGDDIVSLTHSRFKLCTLSITPRRKLS